MKNKIYTVMIDSNNEYLISEKNQLVPSKYLSMGKIILHGSRIYKKENKLLFGELIMLRVKLIDYKLVFKLLDNYYHKLGFTKKNENIFQNYKIKYSTEEIKIMKGTTKWYGTIHINYKSKIRKRK
jgi:hypothetical protein